MAKEKKEITPKAPRDFFYEVTATLIILISLIVLSELGLVGKYLKKGFKFIFGDFYFIIIIVLIINSIYALVKHKWFNSKSLRFNGFLLFIFNLLLLVHFSFLNLYQIENEQILAKTLDLFRISLLSNKEIASYGGGLIGAILSQIFMLLFGKTGSLVLAIIFLLMSFSFMTNLNYKKIVHFMRFIFLKIKSFFLLFYRHFTSIEYPKKSEKMKKNIISLDLLNDTNQIPNEFLREQIARSDKDALINLVYSAGGYLLSDSYYVGYSYTRYIFNGNNLKLNENRIDTVLSRKTILYQEANRAIIEVPHKIKKLLSLKGLLMLQHSELLPLGVEVNGTLCYFKPLENEHMLLSGMENCGIKTFLKTFIITLIFRLKSDFQLFLMDFKHELMDLRYLPNMFMPPVNKVDKFNYALDSLANELEKRLNMLSNHEVNDYLKLNEVLEKKKIKALKPIFVILNSLDDFKDESELLRLVYFIKFAPKCGIFFLIVNRRPGINTKLLSSIKTKLLFRTNNIEQSFEILNNKNGCLLVNPGDVFMVYNLNIYHLQLPFLTNADFNRVIAKYILG